MTAVDYAIAAVCAVMIWICLALLFSCMVAAVSVDCAERDAAMGEAGAPPLARCTCNRYRYRSGWGP